MALYLARHVNNESTSSTSVEVIVDPKRSCTQDMILMVQFQMNSKGVEELIEQLHYLQGRFKEKVYTIVEEIDLGNETIFQELEENALREWVLRTLRMEQSACIATKK